MNFNHLNFTTNTSTIVNNSVGNIWLRAPLTVFAALLTSMTIFGNLFIIVAIRVNQKLKRIHASILITSLALADLLVGSVVMPLAVVDIWTGNVWIFGRTLCRIWTSMDVICCTASIATLCVISIDRYVGVARPLEYSFLVTRKRLWMAVIIVWFFSIGVLLVCMRTTDEPVDHLLENVCYVGNELSYVTYSVILSFYLPLVIIVAFYYRIYCLTQKRKKSFVETRKGVIRRCSSLAKGKTRENHCHCPAETITDEPISLSKISADFRKQNKAAFTLALVVGAFVLCWLPFFVLHMIGKLNNLL